MTRLVLIHGAASAAAAWDRLIPMLSDCEVSAVTRPRTGDLETEVDWLAAQVDGAWVVGMSGGATLGLALAARGVPMAGAILHEPAVGSLSPNLLAPMAAAFADGGTAQFARALYGPSWSPQAVGGPGDWLDDVVTGRELAMFRSFEPSPPAPVAGRVVVTFGTSSPAIRRDVAEALRDAHGYEIRPVPGVGHFAAYDAPELFARTVREVIVGA